MPRHLLPALASLVAALAVVAAAGTQPALGQATGTVGIRIVDVPTDRADDPRARLYIVDHVAPGTTISRRVEVSNDTTTPQEVEVYAAAADVVDGGFRFGEGRAVNDVIRWTTVDPPVLSLGPGAKGLATVTIAVPPTASEGEEYGVVWAEVSAPPPPGGGIGATNRVGVRIYLSVGPGGEPRSDFEVVDLQGQRAADGNPAVAATVRNTGGRALDLAGELRLTGGPGGLSAGPFDVGVGATLGVGQTDSVVVTLDKALPSGAWDATMLLRSGTTEREVSATITLPDEPGSVSDPVATGSGGRGGVIVAVVIGVLVLVAVVVLLLVRRRRRDEGEPVAGGSGTP